MVLNNQIWEALLNVHQWSSKLLKHFHLSHHNFQTAASPDKQEITSGLILGV